MDALIRKLLTTSELANHAPLGLGLSGGLDSMVLAHSLHRAGIAFRALHFNHNWRGAESRADQEFVRQWCRQHQIPLTTRTWRNPRHDEASARSARLHFFRSACIRHQLNALILAHHRDDQAETLLIQLLRGTGPEGLSSMRLLNHVNGLRLIRPLLHVSRADLLRIARSENIKWREDPSNTDKRFTRNKVRRLLIPYLRKFSDRDPVPLLSRTCDILDVENHYWEQLLPARLPEKLPLKFLTSQHPAYQRRLLRKWLIATTSHIPGYEEIEAVRALLTRTSPAKINLKHGKFCRRRSGVLFIES